MAQQGFGVSFLPGGDQSYTRPQGQSNTSPVQEAIKVLSLRVPRVVGATPMAPLALLSGQGGGGLPSGVVETLLRALTPPEPSQPPVAAVPGPLLPSAGAPAGAAPVPQPVQPTSPGIAPQATLPGAGAATGAVAPPTPTTPLSALLKPAGQPAVMPTLTGAPGGMGATQPTSEPAMTSIPMPHISPVTEPAATLPGNPTQTTTPGPSNEGEIAALLDVARRIRAGMMTRQV